MSDPKDTAGPIIRWVDYGVEGWAPDSFPTIEAALLADRYTSRFIITRVVSYRIVEEEPDPLPQTMEASNGR